MYRFLHLVLSNAQQSCVPATALNVLLHYEFLMYWCALYSLHFYLVSNYHLWPLCIIHLRGVAQLSFSFPMLYRQLISIVIFNVLVCITQFTLLFSFLLSFMTVVHHTPSWCGTIVLFLSRFFLCFFLHWPN